MGKVLVSVVVPIFNTEKYLAECLNSLEKQTLKEIEVIMVNDGSTDSSGIIAKRYADKNENFILVERENGGLSAARNTGMEEATGEYIYFLDSDDYLIEDALERIFTKAKQEDLDVLKFVAYTFTEPSRKLCWTSDGYKYRGNYPGVYRGIDILQMFVDNHDTCFPSCCLIITKREVIVKNNLHFYEGIIHEDNLFHWELLAVSERVGILNEPLYCRRIRAGSITQTPDWMKKNMSMCFSAEAAEKFINEHPQIKGNTTDWYVMFFVYQMLSNWEKMSKEEKNSFESKDYFRRVKPIAKKYGKGGSISLRIFYTNITMYRAFRQLLKIAMKILHRE